MSEDAARGLGPLADDYELLGELRDSGTSDAWRARRKSDGLDVVVRVWGAHTQATRAALPQLAADANLLARQSRRGVLPVIESRWLDEDRLAVVYEHLPLPTLDELVDRGEAFPFPRLAGILRGVNAVLEWAREQKIVNRSVTLDTIYVESGSDRVHIAFVSGPIPAAGVLDPTTDARTLAAITWEVLTRSSQVVEGETLAEMRPDLPDRLVSQIEALRQATRPSPELPDAETFVGMVAMAEPLKHIERETSETKNALSAEVKTVREQLENERRDHERKIAEERQKFADERAALLAAVAKERESLTSAAAKEREELARASAKEHEELTREIQRQRDELAKLREDLERSVIREREQLAAMRQELLDSGFEPPPGLGIVAPPLVLPSIPTIKPVAKPREIASVPQMLRETADASAAETAVVADRSANVDDVRVRPTRRDRGAPPALVANDEALPDDNAPSTSRRGVIWGSIGGVVAVGAIAFAAVMHAHGTQSSIITPTPVAHVANVASPTHMATTVDSAAGAIASDSARADSVRADSIRADSIAAAAERRARRRRQAIADSIAKAKAAEDSASHFEDPFALPPKPTGDTTARATHASSDSAHAAPAPKPEPKPATPADTAKPPA